MRLHSHTHTHAVFVSMLDLNHSNLVCFFLGVAFVCFATRESYENRTDAWVLWGNGSQRLISRKGEGGRILIHAGLDALKGGASTEEVRQLVKDGDVSALGFLGTQAAGAPVVAAAPPLEAAVGPDAPPVPAVDAAPLAAQEASGSSRGRRSRPC